MKHLFGWGLLIAAAAVLGSGYADWQSHTRPSMASPGTRAGTRVQQASDPHQVGQTGISGSMPFGIPRQTHIRRLPWMVPSKIQHLADGNLVAAGDSGVTQQVLSDASSIIEQTSLPVLSERLGNTPRNARVVLFSKRESYAKALLHAGIPQSEVTQLVRETGGLTIQSDVWIPLYANPQMPDLANVLTHELTHVMFNQQGIGDTLPTWVNEGTAWEDGLTAESGISPSLVRQMADNYNRQMLAAPNLLPLSATEQDILSAPYNVEWEDYLAVKNLIAQFGKAKYESFLMGVKSLGTDGSFQSAFGMSMHAYETQFETALRNGNIPGD